MSHQGHGQGRCWKRQRCGPQSGLGFGSPHTSFSYYGQWFRSVLLAQAVPSEIRLSLVERHAEAV